MPSLLKNNLAVPAAVALLGFTALGCGQPDTQALKRLACEQAGASLDLQSLAELDALRKALGLAPNVDPIGFCRSLGANMDGTKTEPGDASAESGQQSEPEPRSQSESESSPDSGADQ
jgi:hypothetical protein